MELNELTGEERVALVGLLELVVDSDGTVSEGEVDQLQAVIDQIGDDAYRDAADAVDQRFQGEDALKAFLPTITRQEARELIYETVLEAAMPNTIGARESQLLEWLVREWGVTVRFEEPGP